MKLTEFLILLDRLPDAVNLDARGRVSSNKATWQALSLRQLDRSACEVYSSIQVPEALTWLGTAAGVDADDLTRAKAAMKAAPGRPARRCAAFRAALPWVMVEQALSRRTGPGKKFSATPNNASVADSFLLSLR